MSSAIERTSDNREEFELELYKSLRQEAAMYVEKVPALWLQKFFLVGATITFLITGYNDLAKFQNNREILTVIIASVPILAALLDAKILEYALHAQIISRFIIANYREPIILSKWEKTLWGMERNSPDHFLVKIRSSVTAVVTVVPTMVMIVLAAFTIGALTSYHILFTSLSIIICILYMVATLVAVQRFWSNAQRR